MRAGEWFRRGALAIAATLLLAPALAQAAPEPPLDEAALREHIAWLADDAREGRLPGTAGGDATQAYIAEAFARAGLKPGANGWFQPVPLVERVPGAVAHRWLRQGETVAVSDAGSLFVAQDEQVRLDGAEVVFGGYGIDRPAQGFDEFAGVDLAGRVLLLLSGRPEGIADVPGFEVRREAAIRRGAAAVIALTAASDPWELIRAQLGRGRVVPADRAVAPIEGALAHDAWSALVGEALVAEARVPGFRALALGLSVDIDASAQVRRFAPANVIGRIEGRDPRSGAVFLLAHWDHLGLCRPEGAPDRICNGAVDNASGVAMLIEVARRLARGKAPKRSLYFVATTAEEPGLIGARQLVREPPVPLADIAAVLNLDTVALAPAGAPVAVIGRGQTRLDPLIEKTVRSQRRMLDEGDAANAFLARQDGWVFLQAGVPAVMIGGAFSDPVRLASFLAGDYHGPGDDLSRDIPLDGMAEDGALHVALVRLLASPAKLPLKR